jgi:hypothetical protein
MGLVRFYGVKTLFDPWFWLRERIGDHDKGHQSGFRKQIAKRFSREGDFQRRKGVEADPVNMFRPGNRADDKPVSKTRHRTDITHGRTRPRIMIARIGVGHEKNSRTAVAARSISCSS